MIYRRRALQRRLDEIRDVLDDEAIDKLAARLNQPSRDRLATMWELVVLHALSKCGSIQNEVPLESLRRPDILFERDNLQLVADVTAVSDEGVDKENPYQELGQLIENAKNKLKLPIGGVDIQIRSKREHTQRGTRTTLLLPPRADLQKFVDQMVVPQLREQIDTKREVLQINFDDNDVSLNITINPAKSPYSSYGFAAYNVPGMKDRNPLFNALKAKAKQLRGAKGVTGIIVGDGDCTALREKYLSQGVVSAKQIIAEFFRQYTSVDFVLLLTVSERHQGWGPYPPVRENHTSLFVRDGCHAHSELDALFTAMIQHFPRPAMMPANAARRAREVDYDIGFHGGYSMSASKIRLGLREFTEIFAGLRTLQDNGAKHVDAARKLPQKPSQLQAIVLRNLTEGRLPEAIEIVKGDEDQNDDWIEIRFGRTDPAIAPLR